MIKEELTSSLALRIRQARLAAEMSQSDLARALGIKPQSVQHWENGSSRPKTERISEVASVLGIQAAWLLMDNHDQELARKSASATYGALSPDEQLILKIFRRIDAGRKVLFTEIATVMANSKE